MLPVSAYVECFSDGSLWNSQPSGNSVWKEQKSRYWKARAMEEGISVALRQWVSGHSPAYDWLNVKKCYWNRSEVKLVSGWGLKIALVSFLSRFSVVARGDVWYEKYLWGIVLLRAREHQRRSGDAEWQQQLRGNWTQPPPPPPRTIHRESYTGRWRSCQSDAENWCSMR